MKLILKETALALIQLFTLFIIAAIGVCVFSLFLAFISNIKL